MGDERVEQPLRLDLARRVVGRVRQDVLRLLVAPHEREIPWLRTPGMLAHGDVQRLVGSTDFSILVRQPCRTSQAGFPTKFVESFACGTPVIANLTSDFFLHPPATEI